MKVAFALFFMAFVLISTSTEGTHPLIFKWNKSFSMKIKIYFQYFQVPGWKDKLFFAKSPKCAKFGAASQVGTVKCYQNCVGVSLVKYKTARDRTKYSKRKITWPLLHIFRSFGWCLWRNWWLSLLRGICRKTFLFWWTLWRRRATYYLCWFLPIQRKTNR